MDTLPALQMHDPVLGVMSCTSLVSIQYPDHLLQNMWAAVVDSKTLSMQMRSWQEIQHPR
jgi:hypothetical protein